MTPKCSDCAYVRSARTLVIVGPSTLLDLVETCGIPPKHRPLCADQRAPGGECGPDGKLFAKREGS